jgi:DNA-binding transcriptional LysR family regulator
MMNLNDLRFFVQAVESGGFTSAARHLGVPKSTVSKRVAELEAGLGVRLIHRTSRSFTLSDLGRDFYDHARAALIEAESAEGVVRQRLAEPSGTVRLTASVPTAQFHLAAHLPALAAAYPKLQLVVHVSDRFVDLVQEGFDIAVRSHFAPLPDSALVQRRLTREPIVLVAAPAYLERRGAPRWPQDLAVHDGLLTAPTAATWRLRQNDEDEAVEVTPRMRMVADESVVLLQAAAAGLGITCLPEAMCRDAVACGDLTPVLPGWSAGTVTTTLLMPHRRGQLPAVRAVVDFLCARLDEDQPCG